MRRTLLCLFLLASATVLFRIHYLDVPLERDEGEYAYIAQRMASGDIPYKDIFDQKPPGTFFAYWTVFRLGPETTRAIHAAALVAALLSSWSLFLVVRLLAGDRSALAAGVIFAFLLSDPNVYGFSANTELFMTLPVILSIYPLYRIISGEGGLGSAVACGLLNGLAFLFKQVAAFNMLFCALALWRIVTKRPATDRRILLTASAFGAFALPAVLSLLVFAAIGGGKDYIDAAFINNFYYTSAYPMEKAVEWGGLVLFRLAPTEGSAWILAIMAVVVGLYKRERNTLLLLFWFFASCLGVSMGKRFYPHYFIQWLPPLSALAGIGIGNTLETFGALRPAFLRRGVSILFLCAVVWLPFSRTLPWIQASPEEVSRKAYLMNPFVEAPVIASFIKERTRSNEPIFVFGSEPEIFFYARRQSASRYIYTYPVLTVAPDSGPRRLEYFGSFFQTRPRMVIFVDLPTSLSEFPRTVWGPFLQDAVNFLRDQYQPIAVLPITEAKRSPRLILGEEARRFPVGSEFAIYIFERREDIP